MCLTPENRSSSGDLRGAPKPAWGWFCCPELDEDAVDLAVGAIETPERLPAVGWGWSGGIEPDDAPKMSSRSETTLHQILVLVLFLKSF